MSSIVVHFPDGSREFRFPQEPLKEGDSVWHDGVRHRVIHVATDAADNLVVTVEREPEDLKDLLDSERGSIRLVPLD